MMAAASLQCYLCLSWPWTRTWVLSPPTPSTSTVHYPRWSCTLFSVARVWRGWICTCARLGWEHPALWSDSASSSTKAFIAAAQLHSGEDTADLTPFSHQMQNQRTCNVSLFVCNQSQSTSKYMLIPVRQKYKYVCRKSVSKFVSECDKSGQQRAGNKFNLISVDDSYALPSAQATLPSPSTTHPPRPALWTI